MPPLFPPSSHSDPTPTCSRRHADFSALPFKSHPLYNLRLGTALAAIIGLALLFLGSTFYPYSYYYSELSTPSYFLLAFATFFSILDLICYASRKRDQPDEDPQRPTGRWAVVDLLMALGLLVAFILSVLEFMNYSSYERVNVWVLYGLLADLVCSILHACCFWKQLMSHKQHTWLSKLPRQPCARCGYAERSKEAPMENQDLSQDPMPNVFPYAGPLADFGRANVLTPETPESALEEGLLIGSDIGSNYGAVQSDEPVIQQPENVIVGKGKKKVKDGGSQKGGDKMPSER